MHLRCRTERGDYTAARRRHGIIDGLNGACSAHEDCESGTSSGDPAQPDRRPDRHRGSACLSAPPHRTASRTIATGSNIPLTADAPDEYVVKTGDTLWDISKVFLRDPWYWPEIWYVNPQVANPHLIYPGDVLKLVYVDGQPRLTVGERGGETESGGGKRLSPQVRREPLSQAITAIPYDVIASFMGRPTLLDKDQVKTAPYVVAMRDDHMIGAAGNEVYARGIGRRRGGHALQHHSRRREAARSGQQRPARLLRHVRRLRPGRHDRRSGQARADRFARAKPCRATSCSRSRSM